ncbi:MAG: hypothetical protein UU47_C0017G0020 [candidate division TM6 bacterium GW2011_GWE2_41_16]|nr:MAG: hypothetical protein UU47_C0017G0020 [candidate division TM6 bacterium GW2011_GWE2_41_16]
MSPGPAVARGYGWQARVSYAIRSSLRPKQHVACGLGGNALIFSLSLVAVCTAWYYVPITRPYFSLRYQTFIKKSSS